MPFILRKPKAKRVLILAATTAGHSTHALLDAFTSYGTQLWLPFRSARVAWNWIGIVDPFFTLPLCLVVGIAAWKDRLRPLWIAVAWCALYMGGAGCGTGAPWRTRNVTRNVTRNNETVPIAPRPSSSMMTNGWSESPRRNAWPPSSWGPEPLPPVAARVGASSTGSDDRSGLAEG